MFRRMVLLTATTLLFLAALLLLRPLLARPALTNLDLPAAVSDDSARLAAAAFVPRAFFGRRLEPRNALLEGAGQSDRASFDHYRASTGTQPALWMTYVDLRDDLPSFFAQAANDLAHFDTPGHPVVPQIGLALNAGKATQHYEAETAAGADDAALTQLCTGLRTFHRPAFVRPGYEFNGPWNGYQPAPYVAAFQRISKVLHACSPDIAVVWNWSADAELDAEAAGYSAATCSERLRSFYPGDDAVDWWALNLFTPQGIAFPATAQFLHRAAASGHPVMVAEASPKGFHTTDAAARDAWFAPWFGLLRATPAIKAFCYIDWNWAAYPQWADWGDARLEQSPELAAWVRHQLAPFPLAAPPTSASKVAPVPVAATKDAAYPLNRNGAAPRTFAASSRKLHAHVTPGGA